jgi:hypothetical protein
MSSRWSWKVRDGACGGVSALAVATFFAAFSAARGEDASGLGWRPGSIQLWSGGEYASRYWSAWSGIAYSPFARMSDPGWRLRVVAGGGQFNYTGYRVDNGKIVETTLKGTSDFVEGVIGYQWHVGSWTTKLYGGVLFNELHPDTQDARPESTSRLQPKIALESWLNIGADWWANVDLAYATSDRDYWSRARLGWRARPVVSLGIEGSAQGNRYNDVRRAGLFVRYDGKLGEAVIAAGFAEAEAHTPSAYVTVNWLGRF